MSQVGLVREPAFTSKWNMTMHNYTSFALGVVESSDSPPAEIMFKYWVDHVKNVSLKWRVEKKFHRALPPRSHIQLSLNYTKILSSISRGPTPTELDY
jgi:hypothetical protein